LNRFGFLFVMVFVAASIATALLYHRWQKGSLAGPNSVSSELPLLEQVRDLFRRGQDQSVESDSQIFEFETAADCDPDRNYLSSEVDKFPPIYRDVRARAAADFPRACLTYMMKRQALTWGPESGRTEFAQCANASSVAKPGLHKPCVSENYVNVVYNLFGDVTSCFEIPQKEFLPKLFAESGFHLNAMSAGFSAGIGHLSPAEIQNANVSFDQIKTRVQNSDLESCKRLRPYLDKIQALPIQTSEKAGKGVCSVMAPPQNPLRNLIYLAIKYEQHAVVVREGLKQYEIISLLQQAGLKRVESEQLQQLLITLGFDAGPRSAVLYLKNFIEARLAAMKQGLGRPVEEGDFRFEPDLLQQRGLASVEIGSMSFAQYLMMYQSSGSKDFLPRVMAHAKVLNSTFKEGTCVSDSYLSLSSSY
jgi:hypothetical protein